MVKKNSCIFISGKGTNLDKLIKNSRLYNFPIKITLIVSNNKKAKGLIYAKKYGIPYLFFDNKKNLSEIKILNEIKKRRIKLICLAGYMRILSKKFIMSFDGIIINIHPSLLPKFKGLNTFEKVMKNKEKRTGCSVHYVNKDLDSGKIILKKSFLISKNDTLEIIRKKTQKLEHLAYSEALIKILNK